jgi:hypothetical protein
MLKQSTLPNPLDAQYTAHREEDGRRRAIKEWLRERELGFVTDAPLLVPDHHEGAPSELIIRIISRARFR